MTVFLAVSDDGKLSLGSEHNRARFADFMKKNPGMRLRIEPQLPESKGQRRFFEGAVIPLFAYLDGHDYKDHNVLHYLRENYIKPEFNGDMVVVNGKPIKVGKGTKGKLKELVERVIDWLEEQYGIDRNVSLNTKDYEHYRDVIYPFSTYESYIDYLLEMKKLPAVYLKK